MLTADRRDDPIEFEPPFTDEALALEIQQRQAQLAERAFHARPVGPTTAGRLP